MLTDLEAKNRFAMQLPEALKVRLDGWLEAYQVALGMYYFETSILFDELQHLNKERLHISHNAEQSIIHESARQSIQ
jgi:hypothetical protein